MSEPNWSDEIYLSFLDVATAAARLGGALGVTIPAVGPFPTGDGTDFALVAPMVTPWQTPPTFNTDGSVATAGVAVPGFWAMLTIDQNAASYAARRTALAAYVQTLASPPQVFL